MTSSDAPRLVITAPTKLAGTEFALTSPETVIGHSDAADLVLTDKYVSHRHALITVDENGQVTVHDLNSTGGTFVNDAQIDAPRALHPGDIVRFADVEARFEAATTAADATASELAETQVRTAETPIEEAETEDAVAPADLAPGLAMGTSGPEVVALHDSLTVIGLAIDASERETASFGASTAAAVMKLQTLAGIDQTAIVDQNTIALIELALDRLGIQRGAAGFAARAARYAIGGTVTDTDGMPLSGAKVIAFDCDLRASKEIGTTTTDEKGAYRIAYLPAQLINAKAPADLRVDVVDATGKTLLSSAITFNAPAQATIDLALGGPAHAQPSEFS